MNAENAVQDSSQTISLADEEGVKQILVSTVFRGTDGNPDDAIYIGLNMHWETLGFDLPPPPSGQRWHVFMNTAMPSPEDVWEPGREPLLSSRDNLLVGGRSVVVLVAKPSGQG